MDAQEYAGNRMQDYGAAAADKSVDHQAVAAVDQNGEEVLAPTNEEERLWGIVNANPADFNSWTQLIQETEKLDDIAKFRQCYDTFLAEFPLCYGYWKKYADHENRLATPEKTIEVYERAVKAVTHSVDIWVHYCSFVSAAKPEDPEALRRLFERGLSYVGTDYLAHQLWDKYIDFEYSHSNWVGITQLYTRILQIPLQALDRYFSHFKELANNRPIAELKGPEDDADAESDTSAKTDIPVSDEAAEPAKNPEVERFIRRREELYKTTKEWDAKIREYETAIRRPYFHVKPLDDLQLLNWHRYLDFLEKEADFDKVIKAYERCVIACANYPEYWIRYIHTMEAKSKLEIADDALDRALHIFVKRRPEIHIYAARFKERRGDAASARKEYNVLSSEIAPGLLEVISKHANFEKRQSNIEGACAIYESALEVEKAKEDSRVLSFLYVQYIRFLFEAGLIEKSKEIQALALEKLPNSKVILEAAIHFETLFPERDIPKLESIIERAILTTGTDAGLAPSDREEISNLFLEFLDSYGTVEDCKRAEIRHRQAFMYSRSSESKKRASLDGSVSDRGKLVKTGSTASTGYTNGQAQWGYQQAWPQAQQWSQTYPQAGGYTYTYPQQQTAQSYAAYPQGYQQQDGNWTAASW